MADADEPALVGLPEIEFYEQFHEQFHILTTCCYDSSSSPPPFVLSEGWLVLYSYFCSGSLLGGEGYVDEIRSLLTLPFQ